MGNVHACKYIIPLKLKTNPFSIMAIFISYKKMQSVALTVRNVQILHLAGGNY